MHCRTLIALFFVLGTSVSMSAQREPKTATLSCWAKPTTFHSAKARTPIFHSDSAGSAYADVTATAKTAPEDTQICSNTVRLFYSSDTKEYKLVFHDHRDTDGLGITILGWSKSGSELLFQTDNWPYETEANVERKALIFNSSSQRVRNIPVNAAFVKLFGKDCEFEERVIGWRGDDALLVRISRTPLTESYEQRFCVDRPVDYIFDLKTYRIAKLK